MRKRRKKVPAAYLDSIIANINEYAPEAILYAEDKLTAIDAAREISNKYYFTWKTKERKGKHVKIRIKSTAYKVVKCKKCGETQTIVKDDRCIKCKYHKFVEVDSIRTIHNMIAAFSEKFNILPHDNVHSYIPGKSIISCAKEHVGSYAIFAIDVSDYFFSFNLDMIEKMFFDIYPDQYIAKALAMCCVILDPRKDTHTTRKDIVMPIGITPAGFISNTIPYDLDADYTKLAKEYSLRYTRYSDNLYFSSVTEHIDRDITKGIISIANSWKYGDDTPFVIHEGKTKYKPRYRRQTILGSCVNVKMNITKTRKEKNANAVFGLYKDVESLYNVLTGNPSTKVINHPEGFYRKLAERKKVVNGHLSFTKSVNANKYYKLLPAMTAVSLLHRACGDVIRDYKN